MHKEMMVVLAAAWLVMAATAAWAMQDNKDGTITYGNLVWLQNANCFAMQNWPDATSSARSLQPGMCGLSDKSKAGDWRLPSREELETRKLDLTGFSGVQLYGYWSSTPVAGSSNAAWYINLRTGYSYYAPKSATHSVLPVRSVKY